MVKKNISSIIIALIPFSYIIGTFALNANIILIIVWALLIFIKGARFKIEKIDIFILVFFLYILFTGILNTYEINFVENSINKNFTILSKSLFFIRFFLLYISIRLFKSNYLINWKIIFYSFSVATVFVSIDLIFQYFNGTNIFGFENNIPHKTTGIFKDEAIAGGFLQRFSLFLFFLIVTFNFIKKTNLKIFVLVLFFSLVLTAIILSGNRMPFLLFILSIFLIFITNQTLKKNFLNVLIFVIATSIITISLSSKLRIYYTSFYKESAKIVSLYSYRIFGIGSDLIYSKRPFYIHEFDAGIETYKLNKYFGGGLKSFRYNCPKRVIESIHSRTTCNMHPHNYYLEILVDLGIFGFLLFISITIYILLKTYRLLKMQEYKYTLSPYFYIFLMEMFPLKSSGSFFTTNNSLIIFLTLGFLVSYYWRSHGESNPD